MKLYTISDSVSGYDCGCAMAETPEDAVRLLRDANEIATGRLDWQKPRECDYYVYWHDCQPNGICSHPIVLRLSVEQVAKL